jgi:hypothetical protein
MTSTTIFDTTSSPTKETRTVSFRENDMVHEISCVFPEENETANITSRNTVWKSDHSNLWYTDKDFSRWRSEADFLVTNFLKGRKTKTIVPLPQTSGSQPDDDEPLMCMRGLESLLNAYLDDKNYLSIDTVLTAQRRQRKRGFVNEEEIAAVYSNLVVSSQQKAIERARNDFEVVRRDHEASDNILSSTRSKNKNVPLTKQWEMTLPKRRRDSCSRIPRIFRRK